MVWLLAWAIVLEGKAQLPPGSLNSCFVVLSAHASVHRNPPRSGVHREHPTSPLKVPHANMHRFCQHFCGVPAWGWAPPTPQHWAPHSLLEVLALHISGQGR